MNELITRSMMPQIQTETRFWGRFHKLGPTGACVFWSSAYESFGVDI